MNSSTDIVLGEVVKERGIIEESKISGYYMRQERTPADWYRMLAWIYAWYGQERARGLLYSLYPNL